jgi:hypothetical protein
MRTCACMWGGSFNPIIPVFRKPPTEWRPEKFERVKGLGVARGYVRFFEPDIYVEAEQGLLEEVGLGAFRQEHTMNPLALGLKDLLAIEKGHRDWAELAVGLNVIDILRHLYDTEQRFQPRDKRSSIIVKPERGDAAAEAIFGVYPTRKDAAHIPEWYRNVFKPSELKSSAEAWIEIYTNGAMTPLRVSRHGLDLRRYWYHDLVVYVFDPAKATDLIDLWNLRLEPSPVLPVPVGWFDALRDHLGHAIKDTHRVIRGNPSGLMHHATVEFARSIARADAERMAEALSEMVPKGAFGAKHWRTRIWDMPDDDRVHSDGRLRVMAAERSQRLTVRDDGEARASFDTLSPEFASRYGGALHMRWVNTVGVSLYGDKHYAAVLPFNTFDRRWPRLAMGGDLVGVGREGWVFGQDHKNWNETLQLLRKEEAVSGMLKAKGIDAALSDPGHIATQMLDHLDGLWGVRLLAYPEILQLLNNMAGSVRRVTNDEHSVEQTFAGRSARAKDWIDLLAKLRGKLLRDPELDDYTKRNIIRLGLETLCPHCQGSNWHGLDTVGYRLTCERCLNTYEFPQAHLRPQNENWKYRVVGPFSVPDYGRGSYSSLLALRVLESTGRGHGGMTHSTAMNLGFHGEKCEADFVALLSPDQMDGHTEPELVIGEAKSFGKGELVKAHDLSQLKKVGRKLPGAYILIAVMRNEFTPTEKTLLKKFALWGRRLNDRGRATNPVILLTRHELFMRYRISSAWKELGGEHAKYADFNHHRNLYEFAQATQAIHLGLPSFFEGRMAKRKRRAQRKDRFEKQPGAGSNRG